MLMIIIRDLPQQCRNLPCAQTVLWPAGACRCLRASASHHIIMVCYYNYYYYYLSLGLLKLAAAASCIQTILWSVEAGRLCAQNILWYYGLLTPYVVDFTKKSRNTRGIIIISLRSCPAQTTTMTGALPAICGTPSRMPRPYTLLHCPST